MMNQYLKKYQIILHTESPVFIGSGKCMNKKEYIFDKGTVYVPDFEKMFSFMQRNNLLEKYQDYLLNDKRDFAGWLRNNQIKLKDCMPWIDYMLSGGDAVFEEKGKKEVHTFMKDSYGCPYIPGSSLKGAIRTALLSQNILSNKQRYGKIAQDVMGAQLNNRKSMLQRECGSLERNAFYKIQRVDEKGREIRNNAVNDIMSGIRVSDSKPLDSSCLILCQKVDENTRGEERKMPLLRECLKPGTTVTFELTIDSSLTSLTPEDIMEAIDTFAKNNKQCFESAFKTKIGLQSGSILLGGGAGYQTKTVSYALLGNNPRSVKRISQIIDATLAKKMRDQHKHYMDARLGVSPHTIKCTYYRQKKYLMGVCTIAIE